MQTVECEKQELNNVLENAEQRWVALSLKWFAYSIIMFWALWVFPRLLSIQKNLAINEEDKVTINTCSMLTIVYFLLL